MATSSIPVRLADALGRRADGLLFLLFFGGYAALIAWFKHVDVYHTHFSSTGVIVLLHNLFRVLFIFYLFWMIQAVGAALLRFAGGLDRSALGTLDYLALTFFAGAGPWHVVLFTLGYLSLLNVPAIVMLTAPAVALSFRELRFIAPRLSEAFGRLDKGNKRFKAACMCLVWCALLLVKGLYPGGSDDYYGHYFPAYQAFLEHGSLWPNEAWIHYFYSKGAVLFFLGMLLTDPLAPQLVIFCFMSVAGLATFLFVRQVAPHASWPVIAVLLFFGMFVYTPEWGEFHKLHEFNTAFAIAILWMAAVALAQPAGAGTAWLVAAASAMTAALLVSVNMGPFLAAVFAVLAAWYVLTGDRGRGRVCLAFAALAAVLVAGVLAINFATTGLFNGGDPSFLFFRKFADVEKLHRWGALPMVIWWQRFLLGQIAASGPPLMAIKSSIQSLRLDLLWPLFFGGVLVAGLGAYARHRSRELVKHAVSHSSLVLLAAFLVFVPVSLIAGRAQSSFFRFSSFIVPLVIVAGISMWNAPVRPRRHTSLAALLDHPGMPVVVLALCALMIAARTRLDRSIEALGANALGYALGIVSLDGAYERPAIGYSVGPWRGIYPGARGAYAVAGPHKPIWSLNAYTYCMLPDCRRMWFYAFTMTSAWDRVMWGPPEEARALLRQAGLDYFLISHELPITDPLPLSALFSPDNIARNFGIRWTDGTTTLLTWAGPGTTPPDDAWLAEYRQSVAGSPRIQAFPETGMKQVFDRLNATPHPWRPIDLQWQTR
jgi:hypothetical protein